MLNNSYKYRIILGHLDSVRVQQRRSKNRFVYGRIVVKKKIRTTIRIIC